MKRGMFFQKKRIHTATVAGIILLQTLFLCIPLVRADIFDVGSINNGISSGNGFSSGSFGSVIDDVEKRYHVNSNSIANLGEIANVSATKEMDPQVNVLFTPTDPKEGKEVTAQAVPLFLSSQVNQAYFTWYLKRKGCHSEREHALHPEKFPTPTGDLKDSCDADQDGTVTENDWKVEAMRKIVNGGYLSDQADYSKNSTDDDGYKSQFGGEKRSGDPHCYVHNFNNGSDYEMIRPDSNGQWVNGCTHLFPELPSNFKKIDASGDKMKFDVSGEETGDGRFGREEEAFWFADPADPSTAQNGNKDEANVVGLGQNTFTWNYASDDQVGVVIEGVSVTSTKYGDASLMIMWAFSQNKCDVSAEELATPALSGKEFNGGNASIPTIHKDLNACLSDNLIDPTQGDQAGKLEVEIKTSPDNPIIDSYSKSDPDKRGSTLKARSLLTSSAAKSSQLHYSWRVYANSDKTATSDDAWVDVTETLKDQGLLSKNEGSSASELEVRLNIDADSNDGNDFLRKYLSDDIGYLRIYSEVSENFEKGKKRIGRSFSVVKMTRAEKQIVTRNVRVTDAGTLAFAASSGDDKGLLCESDSLDRVICPVVKGQIVGLSFDSSKLDDKHSKADISWKINNKSLECTTAVSTVDGCDPDDAAYGTANFFPVTGEVGESYTVVMTASNIVSGKTITLSRVFRVVEPSVRIVSGDETKSWPKFLGQFESVDGTMTDNYSQDAFEAFVGEDFVLKGMFYPNSLKDGASVAWSVNGKRVFPGNDGTLSVDTSNDDASMTYAVALEGTYTPSAAMRKAMSNIWGVSLTSVEQVDIASDVRVALVKGEESEETAMSAPRKFFASLVSYVPSSIIFFFRLAVTMVLILFIMGVAFAVAPETNRRQVKGDESLTS